MTSHRKAFNISGPTHLTVVDWRNAHHRRSVAASLIQGVYTLEHDRLHRHGPNEALAPPWWNFFNFKLDYVLVDDVDLSIFGAVYKYKYKDPSSKVPKYVIAFRGEALGLDSGPEAVELAFKCISNKLQQTSRFQLAMQRVENIVDSAGAGNVWLAGHSLGSAMALLVGKNMVVKRNCFLETYLFNPPFPSAPLELIKNEKLKRGLRFAGNVVKVGLALAADARKPQEYDPFAALSPWIPHLFVNSDDAVTAEYIGYFENRKKLQGLGDGEIQKLAMQNPIRNLIKCAAFGKDSEDTLHLLPSAYLTVIYGGPSKNFRDAHRIHQWWNPNFRFDIQLYQYPHVCRGKRSNNFVN
ncbi:GDSL esterase/lipase At4g10955-like [Juglans microcarpa x Juglans regia]|uniref:GDSL esterase/lipase At4g10955-like n=1 Tax=Juglans microcarpa x Juglans regia TaxID=2249226 RepID=UPI001B7DC0FB|nr:GDSL esterase/lipase At4g10955-like [Juglans microcarpa x Juglans regia]XP_041010022.1 GDSL esterase/lipase At4g10955-like [Juglans microcarpa x Juglans regia]